MRFFAHRGALGDGPENTLLAIERAIQAGAQWIEVDIVAHQGRLLVIHEVSLERTTSTIGTVDDYSLNELRMLDAGQGEKIPYIEEVLTLTAGRAKLNIELKSQGSAGLLAILLQSTNYGLLKPDLLVSSFDHRELLRFQQSCPDVDLGLLLYGTPLDLKALIGPLKISSIHLSDSFIDPRFVSEIHELGMAVYVFTVNRLALLDRLQLMGINGVFTDFSALWQAYEGRMQ